MRPIDADELERHVGVYFDPRRGPVHAVSLRTIDRTPTLDAVPVVRCYACKYWDQQSKQTTRACHAKRNQAELTPEWTRQMDYCSKGRLRDDMKD